MSHRHPESIFSTKTWKGENGSGGLRNLQGVFAYLLAASHLNRTQENRTSEQKEIRKEAAQINFVRLYKVGARIKNNQHVTEQERTVWKQVNHDINREVLRAVLRAFDSVVLKNKIHPEVLNDKQSSMIDLFKYIKENQTKLESWDNFSLIKSQLEKMNINQSQ